mmetsp:Transcript_16460/g.21445  ORF Transcript_16460/g.21445 Transcript_16460/m.21445 type:complete len:190 (-) Transcript_16460:97-666(-)
MGAYPNNYRDQSGDSFTNQRSDVMNGDHSLPLLNNNGSNNRPLPSMEVDELPGRNVDYERFVSALEQHGKHGRWDKIAKELGVTEDIARAKACRYLRHLSGHGESSTESVTKAEESSIPQSPCAENNDLSLSWSDDENCLLFTCVAAEMDKVGSDHVVKDDDFWINVSAMIPRKTAKQCREHFYSNRHI